MLHHCLEKAALRRSDYIYIAGFAISKLYWLSRDQTEVVTFMLIVLPSMGDEDADSVA